MPEALFAAGEWAELVRQLYLGRFLCCLGQQGENNEGISCWGYGLGLIIGYADMMRAVCDIDLYQHPWLRQTAHFPMYCAPPNDRRTKASLQGPDVDRRGHSARLVDVEFRGIEQGRVELTVDGATTRLAVACVSCSHRTDVFGGSIVTPNVQH